MRLPSFCLLYTSCDQCLSGPDGTWDPLFLDEDKLRKKLEAERNWTSWAASGNVPFFQYMGFYDLLCCDLRNIALWKSETLFCWFFYKPGTEMECGTMG